MVQTKTQQEREIVWQVSSNLSPQTTPNTRKMKEPVLVKTLIEKTFNKLSVQLFERLSHLEGELEQLQHENTELKAKLSKVS